MSSHEPTPLPPASFLFCNSTGEDPHELIAALLLLAPSLLQRYSLDDFEFGVVLGEGTFGVVTLCRLKKRADKFALKVMCQRTVRSGGLFLPIVACVVCFELSYHASWLKQLPR